MQIVSMQINRKPTRRKGERGAALITTLLISMLLLTAGGALILTTAMSATNAYDSTAETYAYYAAEAGMQATLNVLRGNVSPALTYRDAVTPSTSNAAGDTATTQASPFARLSKWLTYDATFTDRVVLTTPYSPINGSAYNAVLSDPDNSEQITFSTTGIFPASPCANQQSITFNNAGTASCGGGGARSTITYTPQATTTVDAYPSIASLLGKFTTSVNAGGGLIPPGTAFTLTINQTAPWTATIIINCTVGSTSLLTNSSSTVDVNFGAISYYNQGTLYTLGANPLRLNPPNTSGGVKNVDVTLTAPQPKRILVRVNGYGPRGSRKQMEMMVSRYLFDYWPSGLLAIRSADDNVSTMTFNAGSSAVYTYSGTAPTGGTAIPAIAVTSTVDYNLISNIGASGQVSGNPAAFKVPLTSLVSWLQTADAARTMLNKMEATARAQGRYFTNASPPDNYGTAAEPKFTFVDGDAAPDGGHGLLVCTGTVTLGGNDEFKGLMLVLGTGSIIRNGGGNGASLGAFALAKFDRNTWGGPFLAPTFQANGGGTSSVTYDPSWVEKALLSGGRYPIGISEY
ncbi:MAG TPA: hypothetical protein VIW80_17560 [Pyrinomonadaceae bacterium]